MASEGSEDPMENRPPDPQAGGSVPLGLAVRLLDSHYPYMDSDEKARLFAGGLPEAPPFEVPIPEGLTLVGSAALAQRGRRMLEIVLDAGMPAARVRDAYRAVLSADGWEEDHRTSGGGFARGPRGTLISFVRTMRRSARGAAVDVPGLSTIFRHDTRRQMLIVSAEERRGEPTDVRLRLLTGRDPAARRHRNDPEALYVMPLLTPPPRSRSSDENTGLLAPPFGSEHSGGEFGGNNWEQDGGYSFAAIESDLDLASLTAHYAGQLESTGWSRTGEGQDGPQAWNTWAFRDSEGHPWEAAFTVLSLPKTPRRYFLNLRADRTPAS